MSAPTRLTADDALPLTCTRAGTCCHGKEVWLNPWELACLAAARGVAADDFRTQHTEAGGIRLSFSGAPGWNGLPACSQYDSARGCVVHTGRPLACRLYPLGRERRGARVTYLHEGRRFPCLAGCPQVVALPLVRVADYLAGQDVAPGEAVQDAYLEVMQDLADGALVLVIDGGLAAAGDALVLPRWRALAKAGDGQRAEAIPAAWLDLLTVPGLRAGAPMAFVQRHRELLQERAQQDFAGLHEAAALREAAALMLGLALHLGRSLGCATAPLAAGWIATAAEHGAVG